MLASLFAALALSAPVDLERAGPDDRHLTFGPIPGGDVDSQGEGVQNGANLVLLGGTITQTRLSIDAPEACHFAQPYDIFSQSCEGSPIFEPPLPCSELSQWQRTQQACISSMAPGPGAGMGGASWAKSVHIRSESEMREKIDNSNTVEGNGYGVTGKGSMKYVTDKRATKSSAVFGSEAVVNRIRHQTILNPQKLRLTEYFKTQFRRGPIGWHEAQFSSFYVSGFFYGGWYSGTCVLTSRSSDRSAAFEIAAEVNVETASGGGSASSNLNQKASAYKSEVRCDCDIKCSPPVAACIRPATAECKLDQVFAAQTTWSQRLEESSDNAELESISIGRLSDNEELNMLCQSLSSNASSPWYQSTPPCRDIFLDPTPTRFDAWVEGQLNVVTDMSELKDLKALTTTTYPVSDALKYVLQPMDGIKDRIEQYTNEEMQRQLSLVVGGTSVLRQQQDYAIQGFNLAVDPQPSAGWDYAQLNGFGSLADACRLTGSDSCTWSGLFSNENYGYSGMTGAPIAGMHCEGHHCDDKRLLFYPHAPIERTPGSAWSTMVSSEHNSHWHCRNFTNGNYYITQIRCHDGRCGTMQFRCQSAKYVHLDMNDEYQTGKISNDGAAFSTKDAAEPGSSTDNHVTCRDGYVVTGLGCHNSQCAEVQLTCTKFTSQKPGVAIGDCIKTADIVPSSTGPGCCRPGSESAKVPLARVCSFCGTCKSFCHTSPDGTFREPPCGWRDACDGCSECCSS